MSEFAHESCWSPVVACFLLSGLFVGSLYVWDNKHDRNHPSTIKKRFCSIFVVILLSPLILKFFIASTKFNKFTVFEVIGFKTSGILPAAVLPLLLTMTLFLGPLCMQDFSELSRSFLDSNFWFDNVTNLIWLRNIIVGPLAEEFTFRACMVPLLLQCFKPLTAVFVCSLFFGLAHIHHIVERYKAGEPYSILAPRAIVQFSYTALFGAYAAYIFLQTGHFIAPFIVHSFCNVMAFPDFGIIFTYENPKRSIFILVYIAGGVIWYLLLTPMLNHQFYNNYVYFNDNMSR